MFATECTLALCHEIFFLLYTGIPRYPPPYGTMVRPVYPPRPPGAINVPPISRPPVAGIPAVRPIIPPVVRPVVAPSVTPTEKPQTTVYIGKIAPTVENEFMLSLLQLCGPIKSWKRPQDLSTGTPKGFGLYEFESAEGVLRALRLLTKLNIDGQELVVNVNQAMKEYLERYVKKKPENSESKETQTGVDKNDEGAKPSDANEDAKPNTDHSNKEDNETGNKESHDVANFGIITDEDREADREAIEKITKMIEERLKTRPLPPPPPQPTGDVSVNLTSEQPAKTRDGDSDVDTEKNETAENKNERETNSDKPTGEHDRPETPERRHDRKSRERDRDRELKREKERELERYEREAERERIRKEREQRRRVEEAERQYEAYLKEWEYREREKEKERQYEKEKEKERERKRRKEILYDEEDEDEDSRKRWRRSVLEEKRKKRLREKEDDLADRQKEEEEIAEAKKKAEEEQKQQRDALKLLSEHVVNVADENMATEEINTEVKSIVAEHDTVADYSREGHIDDGNSFNINDEATVASVATTDTQSSGNAPTKKLGFGLVGSGKRTTVPSVFHEEEDDDAHKDKKMRPLVPIDYSTEELQAVQPNASGPTPPNLAAAAEFAKRISSTNFKEEKLDGERDRSRRSNEKSNHRDRDRSDEDGIHNRDENKERNPDRDRDRDHGSEKLKTSDNKRLLDAKQLIDMIPKTKEELFSYEIDWAVYDKHQLHERMRPWISKKIKEFLGEEENTLIDYIVSSTQEHVKASQMLERLQIILDEEAEMFVLKMWRMLIFEIKKVETGLALRSKS
ncbi:RNA-binding protein 25 isoform X2 [Abrus precatorius]|uniref:RNA-binding protein 25 isoform X2 n=1 Tax=Abrus precatorius TaxID=3816 RepID=A0A8B8LZJ1_ABRPR|nr:RNA-binding protein 25 isoform X2 [Abrus precatorius]XP_027361802.1 RNA-binding protein 25 isoform X2 [Abrus precatorius]